MYHAKSPFADFDYHTEFIAKTNVGAYLKYKLSRHLGISSGLSKGTWGTKVNYNELNPESSSNPYFTDYRWHLNIDNKYLTIPLAVEYHFGEKINFFAKAGGYYSILENTAIDGFKSLLKFDNTGQLVDFDYKIYATNSKSGIHEHDYGILLGFGATRSLTKKIELLLESNLNIGLHQIDSQHNNDVLNNTPNNPGERIELDFYGLNSHSKNLVIAINAGLLYKL